MVEVYSPSTLNEALSILDNKDCIILSGGTDLFVKNKNISGLIPIFHKDVISIKNISEIKKIYEKDNRYYIGANCSLKSIEDCDFLPNYVRDSAKSIGSIAIRNAGTIGGNICNASPAGDMLPVLYALDAKVQLRSRNSDRWIGIEDFLLSPGKTSIQKGEMLTCISIVMKKFTKCQFRKIGTRKGTSLSKVSFIGLMDDRDTNCKEIRIALGAVGPTVVRSRDIELKINSSSIEEIIYEYSKKISPINDQRSTADYRKRVALNLIKDFLKVEGN